MAANPERERAILGAAADTRGYSAHQRAVALGYGIACHALFAAAIASMIFSIDHGLCWGIGPFKGEAAWIANLFLVVQFPLLHSWLLSDSGRRLLNRLAPLGLGRDLAATSYTAISSLQLLAIFGLWSPSQTVWWRAEGATWLASSALYAGSWLLLLKAMTDSGLDLQSAFSAGPRSSATGGRNSGRFRPTVCTATRGSRSTWRFA